MASDERTSEHALVLEILEVVAASSESVTLERIRKAVRAEPRVIETVLRSLEARGWVQACPQSGGWLPGPRFDSWARRIARIQQARGVSDGAGEQTASHSRNGGPKSSEGMP